MLGLICQGVKLKCQVKFDWSDFFLEVIFYPRVKFLPVNLAGGSFLRRLVSLSGVSFIWSLVYLEINLTAG